MRGTKTTALVALVGMSLLFGASFVGSKIALGVFTPFELIFLRFFIAALLFIAVSPWLRGTRMDRTGCVKIFILTLFEPGVYFYLEAMGIERTLASTAAILICTIPIYVLILEVIWLKVPIVLKEAMLILVSLAGIFLLVTAGGISQAFGGSLAGNLFILGAAFAASVYTVLARKLLKRYDAVAISRLQAIYASLLYLPFAAWDFMSVGIPHVSTRAWVAVVYLGIGCSFLAYLLLNVALTHLKASIVAAFTNVIPVVATGLAVVLLGERLHPMQAVGAAVVVGAVTLLTMRRPETEEPFSG
jgi:drug/metabolite transporter (DMT)-like permease